MPKRKAEDRIEFYSAKIRRLQEKQQRTRRRRVLLSDSSDSENKSDDELLVTAETNDDPQTEPLADTPLLDEVSPDAPPSHEEGKDKEQIPELDPELLTALGDATEEAPAYGEKIHPDLAQRWLPVLRKGITKDVKDTLLKEYAIPENLKLLRAPSLNIEISAAVSDISRARDKKIETGQQQLGLGITAVNRAMSLLLTNNDKEAKIQAIKILSDGCRILTDLHHTETQARIKLITPGLDKAFLNVIQDVERDETLFGQKLSEKIKASKTIEKQGLQIKKTVAPQKSFTATTSQQQTTTRSRFQGNWTNPSRFQSPNRGGRGGSYRGAPASRRGAAPTTSHIRTTGYNNKPRAPTRH